MYDNPCILISAIYFYKQAIHLVPDIESKIADYPTKTNHDSSDSSSDDENDEPEQEIDNRYLNKYATLHSLFDFISNNYHLVDVGIISGALVLKKVESTRLLCSYNRIWCCVTFYFG